MWVMYAAGSGDARCRRPYHPREPDAPGAHGSGAGSLSPRCSGVAGFVALTAGLATGRVAIVVALSSLTSAITVLLGRVVSDMRVAAYQWLAIAAIVTGLILVRT